MNHAASSTRAAKCGLGLLLAVVLLASAQTAASGIQVSPTRIQLDDERRVEAIRLSNNGSRDVSFQLELKEWSQDANEDRYEPTTDLLATPPIFILPAGESRIVRVGLRRASDPRRELSYRLFLEELPPPLPGEFAGLQMVLRLALPVFVAPVSGEATHRLNWQARLLASGKIEVQVHNSGDAHAQVTNLRVDDGGSASSMFYVLPGASRTRRIAASAVPAHASAFDLSAKINGKPVTVQLQLD